MLGISLQTRSGGVNVLFVWVSVILLTCLCLHCLGQLAHAAVTWSGEVDPTNPKTWTSSTKAFIGKDGSGALVITGGDDVFDYRGSIGYNPGSSGVVVVDGHGSTWTNDGSLCVGEDGNGALSISGGGEVIGGWGCIVGYSSGSTGEVTVDGTDSTWTNSQYLFIGNYGSGMLAINNGGAVSNGRGYIGYERGSTGAVTVDGAGSTWTNDGDLDVGYRGNGTLAIGNGGEVIVKYDTYISHYKDLPNTIHFNNGTLSTCTLFCSPGDLTGTGTINANGLVCDVDLVFNSTYGLHQMLNLARSPSQNITINLNVDGSAVLGVGYAGAGSMSISGGRKVVSTDGYIGYETVSMGKVTVDGAGSTWTNSERLHVGFYGTGSLSITNGGVVRNSDGYVCSEELSTGSVIVDGAGSTWINDDYLYLGNRSHVSGTLTITGSGLVSAEYLRCHYSLIKMDSGGMLAIEGEADDSLDEFLGLAYHADIRYWDDSLGDWTRINRATYGEDYTLGYLVGGYLDGYTVLCVGASEPGTVGDATYDGVVDEADATMLARYWNTQSGALWSMGDFNGDGAVNDIDAALLAANWTGDGNANGCSVPEPSALAGLLGLGLAGMLAASRGEKRGKPLIYANFDSSDLCLRKSPGKARRILKSDKPYFLPLILVVCLCVFCIIQPARAGVTWSGTLDPDPATWDESTWVYIGKYDDGSLDITGGSGVDVGFVYLGYYAIGEVTVDGAGSTFAVTYGVSFGLSGGGNLEITNGGSVSSHTFAVLSDSSSTSTITVSGEGSMLTNDAFFTVGGSGNVTMDILSGGDVTCGEGNIASSLGATSTVTVDGAGSTWIISDAGDGIGWLTVGEDGDGTLNVTGGGEVSNTIGQIGERSGSTGKVKVSDGSAWTNSSALYVGKAGKGTLDICGGTVSNTGCYLGYETSATGEVMVNGDGSTWSTSMLTIGQAGNGMLNITGGGSVSSAFIGYVGNLSGSSGKATVEGANSTWTNSGNLLIGNKGNGLLHICNGGAVSNNDISGIGIELGSTGEAAVDGINSTWTNGSDFYVGYGDRGMLTITDGGLVSIAGTLTIDFNEDGNAFINMAAGGMLALHGDADDSLSSFLGLVAGTDAIRYWNYTISDWADIQDATLGDDYTLSYTTEGDLAEYTVLTINTPAPTIVGDANHDGLVNAADAAVLARYWQKDSGVFWGMGDFNDDGVVNDIDAVLLAANWTGSGSPSNGSVPEPSGIAGLLALCLAGILTVTRQKKRMIG